MDTSKLRTKRVIIPAAAVAALGIGGVAWASTGTPGLQRGVADQAGSAAAHAAGGGTVTSIESDSESGGAYEVKVRKADGTEVEVTLDQNLKVMSQKSENESDESGEASGGAVTDSVLMSAKKAALTATGGGTVTEVEAENEDGHAYEVEVMKNGSEWKVMLDSSFKVMQKSMDDD